MFYDSAWTSLMGGDSAFSEKAEIVISENKTITVGGFFFSGSYGQRSEAKYVRKSTVQGYSFRIHRDSLPGGITREMLPRKSLVVRGQRYTVLRVDGTDILTLELKEAGNV